MLVQVFLLPCLLLPLALGEPESFRGDNFQDENDEHKIQEKTHSDRKGKIIPIFQLVSFKNGPCNTGGSRNGTCYTADECKSKGGSGSSSCANGYGVCCIFTSSCGSQSSENCTYLVQDSITSTPSTDPCVYTICKCDSNICRIRLDFETFVIAGPNVGTASDGAVLADVGVNIGDCDTDSFSINSPGNVGSPLICGTNTGQHMFVDASDSCHQATFDIGASGATRQWNIKVTQYACGDTNGGPDGCLQYFIGATGTIATYNFPTTSTTISAQATHLSNQCYTMCIRREANRCAICYIPSITAANPQSFGLSKAGAIIAGAEVGDTCTSDYISIPNAQVQPVIIGTFPAITGRICGRFFSTVDAAAASVSVCSQSTPFKILFKSDADEATIGTINVATTNEQSELPAGIIGFSLNYVQQAC